MFNRMLLPIKQTGIILYQALVLLAMIALLVLTHQQQVLIHAQAFNQLLNRQYRLSTLEGVAQDVLIPSVIKTCEVPVTTANQVINYLKNTDNHLKECQKQQMMRQYKYVFENITPTTVSPIDPLLLTQKSNYWRLTVLSITPPIEALQVVIQLNERSDLLNYSNAPKKYEIKSWRYLTEYKIRS